ncbi:MAG TPA: IclR family transcriptional regulator C-terminal domain-containing protein [Candidatus Limnocylindria bacterium]|nr:IclR family transcriptional regulator C-terminal domain-containing protein [Candidatus Limnocylindria bacterium]
MSRQTEEPPATTRSERVQSLERGLSVLKAFTARDGGLTISEVAERTRLTRATARRLLLTLAELGYVEADRREFRLKEQVLDLAKPFTGPDDPWAFAEPYLQSLTDRLGESASIAVLDGTDILYVARTPTRRLMTLNVSVGSRLPSHATSKGRVLLSFLPSNELDSYLKRSAIARYTNRTVADAEQLRAVLAEVREQGWAIVDQQLEEGLCSVAAPLVGPDGRVSAAISVCAHAGRIDPATLATEFLPLVLETARRISAVWNRR